MRRLGSVLLAVFAVVVFAAAVYVIADNDAPASDAGQTPPVGTAATPLPSAGPTSSTASSDTSGAPSSGGSDGSSSSQQQVVAFLGDDWTAGSGASSDRKRFTSVVSKRLGVTERNFGKSDTGYADGYRGEIDDVVDAKPAVVVVSGGRNDVVDDKVSSAITNCEKLFAELRRRLPDATIIAVKPLWGDSDPPGELQQLADGIEQAVGRVEGKYVDLDDPINGHPDYMADDADPDDKGHAAVAAELASRLEKLLPG